MIPAQQIDEFFKIFGPVAGPLLLFIIGLRLEWWYMGASMKAVIAGKDALIATLIKENAREQEISRFAAQQIKDTVDWFKAGQRAGNNGGR